MSDDSAFFFPELESNEDGNIPLPPEEVRFVEFKPEQVFDDGPKRFRLYVETTPFQVRPTIEIIAIDDEDNEVASASIIEPIMKKNVITLHMRGGKKVGHFALHARIFYPDVCISDQTSVEFDIE